MRFPWEDLMRLALNHYHLTPDAFWRATLRELFPPRRTSALTRQELNQMMQRFPDGEVTR